MLSQAAKDQRMTDGDAHGATLSRIKGQGGKHGRFNADLPRNGL